jgi:D-amino peptidase
MKVLIAADMEGISGITHWGQVRIHDEEYTYGRQLMVADVNAAVEGAFEGGATDVQVSDGHANGTNIKLADLNPSAKLHSGNVAPLAMIEGIQSGFDAVVFIGYHAMAGTARAVMDHTWSSANIANVWINNQKVGETALNAYICGHYSTPVIAVSGDQSLAFEAQAFIPGVEAAIVKFATSRESAVCLPLEEAHQIIFDIVKNAVSNFKEGKAPAALTPPASIELQVEFFDSIKAARANYLPGSTMKDARTVSFTAKDMPEAFFAFRSMSTLAN